jgi:hypothetical protein
MTSKTQAHLFKELNLLVNTGLGVAPIAPALSTLLCQIIGAEAGGMCWFNEAGMPEGFYQSGAPRDAEELFMNHYEELFVGPHEYTPFWSIRNKGRRVGNTLQASKEYFRSNTYNLLIKPSNCHFLLDALVDLDGVTRLTACFFRSSKNPFTEVDAKKLTALVPVLRCAIGKRQHALTCRSAKTEGGYMLISEDGDQVEMIDGPAHELLATIKLFDQNISLVSRLAGPPRFVQLLCKQLRREGVASAKTETELAGGTLVVNASWMAAAPDALLTIPERPPAKKILVLLQFRQAGAVEVVRSISAWGLSPLQGRIAMYAAAGGSRIGCAVHHRVSKEALKKHLREIYAASRCGDWQELAANFRGQPTH